MSGLLVTKLRRPSILLKRVERNRLIDKLNASLASGHPLILVSAPAGFGKSTCISAWIDSLKTLQVAWLSLDSMDNDPVRFFAYFIAALQMVDEQLGQEISGILRAGQLPPAEVIGESLLSEIQDHSGAFLLILDDFHIIHNHTIIQVMEKLIANAPAALRLVIITREDPPLPLARLRAHAQLTEIRAEELRFTVPESDDFLNAVMNLGLSPSDVAALEERTEGWVVGLQLAGLSLRGRVSTSDFIASLSGSHRYILAYFTEEVLRRQTEETRQFLLQTSILERLSGDLCDAVTGRTDSGARLEQLAAANLFIIPLDDEGQWFRYHHLFADLLQAHLRQAASSGEPMATLHRRAGDWFENHGWINEAVNHALEARDFDTLARLIEQQSFAMVTRGELNTVLQWISHLPDEATQHRPAAAIGKAWLLTFSGAIQQVEPLLQQVDKATAGDETTAGREMRGNAAAMRAFISIQLGDFERGLALAELAESLLTDSSFPDGGATPFNIGAHSVLPYTLGTAYRGQGQYDRAAEAFEREVRMAEAAGNTLIWVGAIAELANTRRTQGRLKEAAETCRQALRRLAEQGQERLGSFAKLDAALAEILREQNELEEAHHLAAGAVKRVQGWNMPADQLFITLVLMHIQESLGDVAGAFETLKTAQDLKTRRLVFANQARSVDLHDIRLHLAVGDVATAARLIDDLRPGENSMAFIRQQELILLGRVRLAQGRVREAIQILEGGVNDAGAAEARWFWLETLVLYAHALDEGGDREAALTHLMKALRLGEPEGFVRVFVDEGPDIQSLLATATSQLEQAGDPASIALKGYTTRILDAFTGSPRTASALPVQGQAERIAEPKILSVPDPLVEPLTDRELEVLQLIAEGLKYQEIAGRLFISLNTVRTYVKAIYSKLDANNRIQAVMIARQIQIL